MTLPTLVPRTDVPGPPQSLIGNSEPLVLNDGGQLVSRGEVRDGVQFLAGTPQRDVIAGGYGRDFIDGGPGSDEMTGGPDRDVFRRVYGDVTPDLIIDFAVGGDRLQIGAVPQNSRLARLLRGRAQCREVLCEVRGLDQAMRDDAFFAYQKSTGRLFFNANGKGRGWGRDGGIVVNLLPGTPFSWADLQFDSSTDPVAASMESLV
jgi:Ca2+-binding RTX toxin-like protein